MEKSALFCGNYYCTKGVRVRVWYIVAEAQPYSHPYTYPKFDFLVKFGYVYVNHRPYNRKVHPNLGGQLRVTGYER